MIGANRGRFNNVSVKNKGSVHLLGTFFSSLSTSQEQQYRFIFSTGGNRLFKSSSKRLFQFFIVLEKTSIKGIFDSGKTFP